jgi:hypothetical protein
MTAIIWIIEFVLVVLAVLAVWWFMIWLASTAWHAGQPSTGPRSRDIIRVARDRDVWDQAGVPAVPFAAPDQTLVQPAVQPGRYSAPEEGGVCVVGHYIEPRYVACWAGHKYNHTRTVGTTAAELGAAMRDAQRRAADATDRAVGAPW